VKKTSVKHLSVSVVIPARDRKEELAKCLKAACKSVLAGRMRAEVIVVDDGTPDESTREV
jgi:glycosyltransferase involved in cell wall biosynthesis